MISRYLLLAPFLFMVTSFAASTPESTPVTAMTLPVTLRSDMPVFGQENPAFDGNGSTFCGPASACNALLWLANKRFPALRPSASDDQEAFVEMVKQISTHMGTYSGGTQTENFIEGIIRYLNKNGLKKDILFQHYGKYHSYRKLTVVPPDLSALEFLSNSNSLVWLNIGWYSFDSTSKSYTREIGHWTALAGVELSENGALPPKAIVVSDSRFPGVQQRVTLTPFDPNSYIWVSKVKAKSAGFFELPEFSKTKYGDWRDQKCLLESIVVLQIKNI